MPLPKTTALLDETLSKLLTALPFIVIPLIILHSPFLPTLLPPRSRPRSPPPPPLRPLSDPRPRLLIACTGSVATIKLPLLLAHLSRHSLHAPHLRMRLLLSRSAQTFLQGQAEEQPHLSSLLSIPGVEAIYSDADEWVEPWRRGGRILHIELRRWADVMLVAPLSANALAGMVGGRGSDLIGSVMRAWDTRGGIDGVRGFGGKGKGGGVKRIVVAPAMNTAMWEHPVTAAQVAVLEGEWGVGNGGWVEVLRPVEKALACGDTGSGAMRDWREIATVVEERLGLGGLGGEGKAGVNDEEGEGFVRVDKEVTGAEKAS